MHNTKGPKTYLVLLHEISFLLRWYEQRVLAFLLHTILSKNTYLPATVKLNIKCHVFPNQVEHVKLKIPEHKIE